jgi:hypothetical protein
MNRAAGPAYVVNGLKEGMLGEGAARTDAGNLDFGMQNGHG